MIPPVEVLQRVLDRAGVAVPDWDIVIIGDGSGTGWKGACGWAGVLVEKNHPERGLGYGGMNVGSINLAELMPYLQTLNHFHEQRGREILETKGLLRVHVLTDSSTITAWGNRVANLKADLPKTSSPFHAAMRQFGRLGYHLQYHWGPRSQNCLNWASDLIAALSRRGVMRCRENADNDTNLSLHAANAIDNVRFCDPATGEPIDIHDLNPSEDTNASTSDREGGQPPNQSTDL